MNYEQSVEYILSIPLFGKKTGHDNVKELLKRLGNPHQYLNFIHVAGTNGKGSVCAMLSYIYIEANNKVGLFTSPHLEKINERIKINNNNIKDNDFLRIFLVVKSEIDNMVSDGFNHPAFFETLFVMAVLFFKEQNVNIAVIETGLGGKLDATNIIEKPLLSIITQIGLDHTGILGDTVEKIAIEKAGIIKDNCPVVVSAQENTVLEVIREKAKDKNSFLQEVMPIEYKILKRTDKGIDFSLKNKYYYYNRLSLNICATYQIINLATALNAIDVLKEIYPVKLIEIEEALKKFYWPGRMEVIDNWLVLDGAHNENGIKEFVENINFCFNGKEITLLFTAMRDKSYESMIMELSKCKNVKKIIVTKIEQERCLEPKIIKECFERNNFKNVYIELELEKVLKEYFKRNDELLCCVGSLYLIGEIKKIIRRYVK